MIAAVLVIALVSGGALDKSGCVEAQTCNEAFADYVNADGTYENARISYFYNQPTTCVQDCQGNPSQPQCINDCQITRHTALGNAELSLFSIAGETCTPETIDQCANARAMADSCSSQYDYQAYSDPDEAASVYSQYSACRLASKVDSCQ